MRKPRLILSAGAVAALAAAGIAVQAGNPAFATSHARAATPTTRVFTVTEKVVSDKSFNLDGGSSLSVGTTELSASRLWRGGKAIGRGSISCVMTRVTANVADALCTQTLVLPDGQLSIQGLITSTPSGAGTFQLAIVGGTGAYRNAHGYDTVHSGKNPTDTLHISW